MPVSILLVDDKRENLFVLEELLGPLGQRLVSVMSGHDALKQVLVDDFAVIVLDVHMPGMDGLETAALIKARERSRTTPIIFLTAGSHDDRRLAMQGYELGAVDYIAKPCDPDVLRAKVAVFVRLAQAERARVSAERRSLEARRLSGDLEAQAVLLEEQTADAQELARRLRAANERLEDALLAAERARAEAERANRAKSDFLAVMSHELRTPLNAIIGYEELIAEGIPGPVTADQRQYLGRLKMSARHLLVLIDEILTMSRIEAGRETVQRGGVDVAAALEEAAAVIHPLAQSKGLAFVVDPPGRPLAIETDGQKLRQMLVNLLSNAVKFTERGRIVLRAGEEGDSVCFEVEDTGIGIAAWNVERIFEPFWQVEQTATRRAGGTGLGLSVTRQLARLLGGDVTVESEVGRGSTFTIRLPRVPRGPAAQA